MSDILCLSNRKGESKRTEESEGQRFVKISELWQWVKQHLVVSIFITGLVIFLVVSFIGGYFFNWLWTGLSPYTSTPHATNITFQREKTLWDWLQLLIIPLVIAIGGYLFNLAVSRTEQQNTKENQREAALQAYIDKISELLLREHLDESPSDTQVQVIARARTATVLRILDPARRGSLIRFLSQAGILVKCTEKEKAMAGLGLHGADLSRLNLSSTNLSTADLSGAYLSESDLSEAFLIGAKLCEASLWEANFSGADLTGADLSGALLIGANLYSANLTNANLNGANLNGAYNTSKEQLEQAKSLKGATMPDGSKHP
jgi:uncharacterized protein YjbI with pentapeptide repeats